MATKNLIPRGSGEGGIGITGTSWGSGIFNSGIFIESLTVGGSQVALSSELSNYATSADLSNYATTADLSSYATTADLSSYATTADLSSYATTGDLSSYASTGDITDFVSYDNLTGHLIPDTNAAYDLGNAEYKIRHLFLSDNSLHIGGTTISAGDTLGEIQFPSGIAVTKDSSFDGKVQIGNAGLSTTLGIGGTLSIDDKGSAKGIWFGDATDPTNPVAKGYIGGGVFAINDVNSGDFGISSAAGKNLEFGIGGSEKMRINSSGNVGIGTTSPTHDLTIGDGTDSSWIKLDGADGSFQIGVSSITGPEKYLSIYDTEAIAHRFVISESGEVGVGVTSASPGATLEVQAHDDSTDAYAFWVVSKDHTNSIITAYEDGNVHLGDFFYNDASGSVGIGTQTPGAKLDVVGDILLSGVAITPDENQRIVFGESGIMVGQAEVRSDPDNPESLFFQAIPQVKDSEGNAVTVLTADKLGLGTADVLTGVDTDLKFKLLTDQQRFVVGTTGDYGLESGWYRFNDFKVKGATDIGAHPINPVDTRVYSDESSFVLFKKDTAGNRVAHLVGGDEEVSSNNAIALGIAVKVDQAEYPEDIEFVHTDGGSYSVINGNSDSVGINGLPVRQGFQSPSLGANPSPLLIDGGSF